VAKNWIDVVNDCWSIQYISSLKYDSFALLHFHFVNLHQNWWLHLGWGLMFCKFNLVIYEGFYMGWLEFRYCAQELLKRHTNLNWNFMTFFFNFVTYLNWRSFIRLFSQIWLQTRYETRKK
jgi:hypothetical protein